MIHDIEADESFIDVFQCVRESLDVERRCEAAHVPEDGALEELKEALERPSSLEVCKMNVIPRWCCSGHETEGRALALASANASSTVSSAYSTPAYSTYLLIIHGSLIICME